MYGKIECQLSVKGTALVNEDIVGHHDNIYWVMDGATDLFKRHFFSESDPNFAVNKLNQILMNTDFTGRSLEEGLKEAVAALHQQLIAINPAIIEAPAYEGPTFTIVLVRVNDDGNSRTLDYAILGDSSLVIEKKERITDERLAIFGQGNAEKFRQAKTTEERYHILQATRSMLNQPDGYWIGSIDGAGISNGLYGYIPLEETDRVVLFTDGFEDYYSATGESLLETEFTVTNILKIVDHQLAHTTADNSRLKSRDDITILSLVDF